MIQNYDTYEVFQVQELNINEFDTDQDGIVNNIDNCLNDFNPDQADIDDDGMGDICIRVIMQIFTFRETSVEIIGIMILLVLRQL